MRRRALFWTLRGVVVEFTCRRRLSLLFCWGHRHKHQPSHRQRVNAFTCESSWLQTIKPKTKKHSTFDSCTSDSSCNQCLLTIHRIIGECFTARRAAIDFYWFTKAFFLFFYGFQILFLLWNCAAPTSRAIDSNPPTLFVVIVTAVVVNVQVVSFDLISLWIWFVPLIRAVARGFLRIRCLFQFRIYLSKVRNCESNFRSLGL